MKHYTQFAERIEQTDLLKHIERCGRICYKSEDKISEESAGKFVTMLLGKKHYSPLEHGTIYLTYPEDMYEEVSHIINSPYTWCNKIDGKLYITTNYRVIIENCIDIPEFLKSSYCEGKHEPRYTVRFFTSRAIIDEIRTHRVFSYCVESTRYCNYSKDKFSGVSFITPHWDKEMPNIEMLEMIYYKFLQQAEHTYLTLLEEGLSPQDARGVLPLDVKSEMIMTGFKKDWIDFYKKRTAAGVHPQLRNLLDCNIIKEIVE